MKITYHRQCKLRKGITFYHTWIPEKYAKKGKTLIIKGDPGWVVDEIYTKAPSKEINERSQDYKHQREASDI